MIDGTTILRNWTRSRIQSCLIDLEKSVAIFGKPGTLCGALEKLSVNQRLVIDLAYFEGYSQSEMAARLGQPLGTINTRVRSALNLLRD
jgi:hypothetical protein